MERFGVMPGYPGHFAPASLKCPPLDGLDLDPQWLSGAFRPGLIEVWTTSS